MKGRDEKQPDLMVGFIMDRPAPIYSTVPAARLQFERRRKTELQTSAKK